MNPRTTAILALVLLVLGGVAFFMERQREQAKAPATDKIFPQLALAEVDGIEIRKQDLETRLAKRGGEWIVLTENEKPAEPKLVQDLLTDLEHLVASDLVSTNASNHAVYEVAETGVEVALTAGGSEVARFVVGKPGPDFMSTYVRPADSDETYRIPVYLRTRVDRGGQAWRNKTLVQVPQEEVAAYTTMAPGDTVRVERSDSGWRVARPYESEIQSDIMTPVMSSLATIKAVGFADTVDAASVGLVEPAKVLEIETRDGTIHVVEIGTENPSRQTFTRLRGDDQIYLVPVGRWNTVFRKPEDLALPRPAIEVPGATSQP